MTDELGIMVYADNEADTYMGRTSFSEATMSQIDATIRKILETQYKLAKDLIIANRDKVEIMAQLLLKQETIDSTDIDKIMSGELLINGE